MLVSAAVIKVTVRKAARKRGIKNWYRLAQRLANVEGKKPDGASQELAKRLWRDYPNSKLESIDAVAEAFDCELSELLIRVPNKRTRRAASPKRSENNSTNGAGSRLTNQVDQR